MKIDHIRSAALTDSVTGMVERLLEFPDLAKTVLRDMRLMDYPVDAEHIANALLTNGKHVEFGAGYYDDGGNCWEEAIWWIDASADERVERIEEIRWFRDQIIGEVPAKE
jgi:hypothetical protein